MLLGRYFGNFGYYLLLQEYSHWEILGTLTIEVYLVYRVVV